MAPRQLPPIKDIEIRIDSSLRSSGIEVNTTSLASNQLEIQFKSRRRHLPPIACIEIRIECSLPAQQQQRWCDAQCWHLLSQTDLSAAHRQRHRLLQCWQSRGRQVHVGLVSPGRRLWSRRGSPHSTPLPDASKGVVCESDGVENTDVFFAGPGGGPAAGSEGCTRRSDPQHHSPLLQCFCYPTRRNFALALPTCNFLTIDRSLRRRWSKVRKAALDAATRNIRRSCPLHRQHAIF